MTKSKTKLLKLNRKTSVKRADVRKAVEEVYTKNGYLTGKTRKIHSAKV